MSPAEALAMPDAAFWEFSRYANEEIRERNKEAKRRR